MSLSRRDLLRLTACGAASTALGPLLRGATTTAPKATPRRFVFVVKASGIDKQNLVPGAGAYPESRETLVDQPLADLPAMLSPLADLRKHVTIVQGLSGQNFKGNHTAGYGTLSCHNSERVPIAPTVDALLGRKFSDGPYTLYGMATNGALLGQASVPDNAYVFPNISALKKGQGVAFQASPTKAYEELFGTAAQSQDALDKTAAIQRNLTRFLEGDAARVREKMDRSDQQRFDGYVETFAALRDREAKKAALRDRIVEHAPEYVREKYEASTHMGRMECQFELGTAALLAGLTNVVTLRPDTLGAQYQGLGANLLGVHAIGHGGGIPEGPDSPELRRRIDGYHLKLIAKMAKRLASVPEGSGTMLDNTLIVYTSCAGGKHHGGNTDWPFVLVGGNAGTMRTGRYLQLPSYGKKGHRTIGNLYLSLLHSGGIETDEYFGQPDPQLRDIQPTGPISQLLT